jgi:hypothetical protein
MGPIGNPEASGINQPMLRNISEYGINHNLKLSGQIADSSLDSCCNSFRLLWLSCTFGLLCTFGCRVRQSRRDYPWPRISVLHTVYEPAVP